MGTRTDGFARSERGGTLREMRARKGLRTAVIAVALGVLPVAPNAGADPLPVEQPGLPKEAGPAAASSNVELLANFPQISAIGARLKGDYLYSTGVDGLSIYNVALTGLPILQGRLPLPHWENEDVDTNGKILLISADHLAGSTVGNAVAPVAEPLRDEFDILYVIDVSIPQAPLLLARLQVPMAHTVSCILNCTYAWLAGGNGIAVVDLRVKSSPRYVGRFYALAGNTHDVQVDAKGIAWVSGTKGLYGYKPNPQAPTNPTEITGSSAFDNDFIIHNSLRPDAAAWKPASSWSAPLARPELTYVTEEDYLPGELPFVNADTPVVGDGIPFFGGGNGNCTEDGSFQIGQYRQVGSVSRMAVLSRWHLGKGTEGDLTGAKKGEVAAFCSSHYFDVRGDLAAVGWYEQGLRILSVRNPSQIRQVGYWRPFDSTAWSATFVGDYIYVIDLVRGLDVLRFNGNGGSPTVKAANVDPLRRTRPSDEWGLACRLPLRV